MKAKGWARSWTRWLLVQNHLLPRRMTDPQLCLWPEPWEREVRIFHSWSYHDCWLDVLQHFSMIWLNIPDQFTWCSKGQEAVSSNGCSPDYTSITTSEGVWRRSVGLCYRLPMAYSRQCKCLPPTLGFARLLFVDLSDQTEWGIRDKSTVAQSEPQSGETSEPASQYHVTWNQYHLSNRRHKNW